MNKFRIVIVMCCIFMFAQVGFAGEKIGIVDIQKIVCNSSAVKALKQEHNAELESLNSIVKEAQNAIAKETDPQKIIELQDKYNSDFNRRKEVIDNRYRSRLTQIEESLRCDIAASAKKNNYDIVIAKNVVFYGGDDITDLVANDIK